MFKIFKKIFRLFFPSRQAKRVKPWLNISGDKTLRLDYDLNKDSVVFDLGGYEGQWASDIYAKYNCRIYIFEPVPDFAAKIKKRFERNDQLFVFDYGLAEADKTVPMAVAEESSSMFKVGADLLQVPLRDVVKFLSEQGIDRIDLMKINIEGGEYDLLDRLIESGWIKKINNLQVQFHDFAPQATERMKKTQSALANTHDLTYQYEFVWENWRIKQ